MISKIISRAACLAERTSNPKSFFNCPDLHGGSGLPELDFDLKKFAFSIRLATWRRRLPSATRRIGSCNHV